MDILFTLLIVPQVKILLFRENCFQLFVCSFCLIYVDYLDYNVNGLASTNDSVWYVFHMSTMAFHSGCCKVWCSVGNMAKELCSNSKFQILFSSYLLLVLPFLLFYFAFYILLISEILAICFKMLVTPCALPALQARYELTRYSQKVTHSSSIIADRNAGGKKSWIYVQNSPHKQSSHL